MASFSDLPEDLVEYIFLHLSPYGELQTCRLVCRDWHRLANGALDRLRTLFLRCSAFDWFLLQRPENEKFSTRSSSIAERCSHAACYHPSGAVFVFGGCTAAYTTFNDLWRFNLTTRTWFRPVPMGTYPTPKACSTMVEYRGSLILFGGWSKSSPNPIHQTAMFYNELHVYDPATNFWTQIANDGTAPHLAGHSATIVGDRMIVFGGSHGTVSSNQVWVFDIPSRQWFTPATSTPKPLPRYGQSQILIDQFNVLIIGGCGGPNLIFSDVWLLTMVEGDVWQWHEITVINSHLSAPQLWSHPACKIGNDKLVVLSKQPRSSMGAPGTSTGQSAANNYRLMSASPRTHGGAGATVRARGTWVPPQGNLIPPRRKLISSRSLDEENPSPSPKSAEDKKTAELQRAHSIPAIIVGEIPKLVVTEDNSSAGENPSTSGAAAGAAAEAGTSGGACVGNLEEPNYSRSWPSPCIAVVASSLLPQHATPVELPPPPAQEVSGAAAAMAGPSSGSARGPKAPGPSSPRPAAGPPPSGKDKRNREKQLEVLRRMEEYIRSKSQQHQESAAGGSGMGEKMKFRPSSPPPKPKQHRPSSFHPSKNPMCVYLMDLSKVLTDKTVTWRVLEGNYDAPEDTILYSLVQGRGELILFGGMRSNPMEANQGLDVTPFSHTITNETYILRPPITF